MLIGKTAKTERRPARLDLAEVLDSAEEALEYCGVSGPVDVVGHSQGAFVALTFAINVPSECAA